jgi:hypothetical protein
MYIIEVENWEEDIYTLDEEFSTLKEATEKAQKIAYKYKAIGIYELDKDGNEIREYDIYGEVL